MALFAKPSILRHSILFAPSKRLFSAHAPASQALRFTTFIRPNSTILSRSRPAHDAARSAVLAPKVYSFHTSSRREIFPPGPQVVEGTMNDPAKVPKPSPTHGSYHWTFERVVAAGLIPLTIAPFAAGSLSPVLDAVFVSALIIHSHIGFQSCIIDYFPNWQMPTIRRMMFWILNLATVAVGVGFYEFETNDVGLTEAVKRIWQA